MQPMYTGEPVARSPDALARPASNNMPLSEHDTQELRRLLYLKAEGIKRQERLQYLRQTWKSSIWSEEDDDSYTLPDPEILLVYSLHSGQQCPPEWDDGSVPAETADRQKRKDHGKSNLHAEEDFLQKLESLNLDPRLKKLLLTYEEVFGALPPPLSCKKLVQMDLKLKPEFEETRVRRRPYPAPQEQVEEIERQIQECIDAGLVEEYKKGDYPHHCSPCFLVAKPGSTALRLVVDYGEVNKKTHSGSIPNMENTLERIAKCRYKTKMDKRSGFWQADLTGGWEGAQGQGQGRRGPQGTGGTGHGSPAGRAGQREGGGERGAPAAGRAAGEVHPPRHPTDAGAPHPPPPPPPPPPPLQHPP